MKTTHRLVAIISLVALIGFMLAAVSCTSAPSKTTGLTPGQTITLLLKWSAEYKAARAAAAAPTRTEFDPLTDFTSAKAVLRGVAP